MYLFPEKAPVLFDPIDELEKKMQSLISLGN